jgi:outer membrane biosynthesis protein TonB
VKKATLLLLGAMSLALTGCGGSSEEPEAETKKESPKGKDGEKAEPNPWAKDPPPGSEPTAAPAEPKKKKKKKGKEEDSNQPNPWAKDQPTPAPTE